MKDLKETKDRGSWGIEVELTLVDSLEEFQKHRRSEGRGKPGRGRGRGGGGGGHQRAPVPQIVKMKDTEINPGIDDT
eukprot:768694-Hanusia_phi.AAC.10